MKTMTFSPLAIGILIGALGMCLLTQERFSSADCPGEPGVPCNNGDVNADGGVDLADAIYILSYLFGNGPEIVSFDRRLPATGQRACYDTGGNVIDCDGADWPGQDGLYQAGCQTEGRFADNGDGTVTDMCTGLMWQQDTAPGTYLWQEALEYCDGLELAGNEDWRLPNVRELQSIVDYGRVGPAIDTSVFNAVSNKYWSSTTCTGATDIAWLVSFGPHGGGVRGDGHKDTWNYVRAVRSR